MTPSNSLATDRGQRRQLFALLTVVAFGAMAVLGYLIWSGYRDAIREAGIKTRNYAAIIEARLDATLRRADATLLELTRNLPVAALSKQAIPRFGHELNAKLDFHGTNFLGLDGLQVFDAHGDQLYSSYRATTPFTNIVDRGYFRRLRDNPQAGLVFSEVVTARATGRPTVFMSRALQDGQGAFRGVVIAGLHLEHFRRLFQSLDVGAHGVVAIYRSDDFTPVVRWPPRVGRTNVPLPPGIPIRAALATGIKIGTVEISASSDGVVRIYSFHALDRYPLFVAAGLARDEVLAGWRAHALSVGLSGLLLLGLLVGLLIRLWRAQARQAQAMAELGESEGRFRVLFEQAAVGVAMSEIATGRFVRVNRKYADILGYSPEEILQLDFRRLTHPDDLSTHLAARAPFMAGTVSEFTVDKRYLRKDGSVVWAKLTVSQMRIPGQTPRHHIGLLEDISERKRAEEALRDSEQELRAIFDGALDGILVADAVTKKFVAANLAICSMLGYTHEEIVRIGVSDIHPKQDLPRGIEKFEGFVRGETQLAANVPVIRKDGSIFYADIKASPIRLGGKDCLLGMFRDITESKWAQEALRESEARYRSVFANSNVTMLLIDPADGRIVDANSAACAYYGWDLPALQGMTIKDINTLSPEQVQANLDRVREERNIHLEFRHRLANGEVRDVEIFSGPVEVGGRKLRLSVIHDITERKRAEQALREHELRLRLAQELGHVGVWDRIVATDEENFSDELNRIYGLTPGAIRTYRDWLSRVHPDDVGRMEAERDTAIARRETFNVEFRILHSSGEVRWISGLGGAEYDHEGRMSRVLGVNIDITERKRAEQALRAAEVQFRSLVEQSIAGIYVVQDGKFAYVNRRCAEIFGYDSADEMIGRDVASLVAEKDRDKVTKNVRQRTEGETATLSYDFTGVRKDGSTIDVGAHSGPANHNNRPAIIGLMQDISEKRRAEEQIRNYVAQLETAFMSTVQVATTLSELRDPYTAGHERRVAEIAVAIGAELGIDAGRIEGLRVAGHLHDIGKITIPSEILAKPGKLTAIEFQLVKEHAQGSYEVLKEVKFPWPVAQVALQHHERIDGSGYPQGLKGEAILLEARVMAVADVVEAMASHRPYRPGLGIEKALAEVERGRGTLYDAVVADACLRLFREKGFQLPA